MALVPRLQLSEDCARCGCIVAKDITGVYNANTNTGGFGSPNIAFSDVDYIDFQVINVSTGVATNISGNGYLASACSPEMILCGGVTSHTETIGGCSLCPEEITVTTANVPVFGAGCYVVRELIYTSLDYSLTTCDYAASFNQSLLDTEGSPRQFQVKQDGVWLVKEPTLTGTTYTWTANETSGLTEWRIVDSGGNLIQSGTFTVTDCSTATVTPDEPRLTYWGEAAIRITCPIERMITAKSNEIMNACADCLDKQYTSQEVAKIALCRSILAGMKDISCSCNDFAASQRRIEKILSSINPKPC